MYEGEFGGMQWYRDGDRIMGSEHEHIDVKQEWWEWDDKKECRDDVYRRNEWEYELYDGHECKFTDLVISGVYE